MKRLAGLFGAVMLSLAIFQEARADLISDITNTKHNFSATIAPQGVERQARASTESQICAFCHTPHGATPERAAPLWNRQLSSATYIPFTSTSLDATDLGQPGGKSKLCLSCHDGTIALGSVNVLNRVEFPNIPFTGTQADGTIPEGMGALTGFTRRLGVDLSNDHPISFTFDSSQAARDGELFDPAVVPHINERTRGSPPAAPQGDYLPLEDGKVECISCHDPHVRSDVPGENNKFLRVNRFQKQAPVDGQFDLDNDIICLGCHDKDGWVDSAHAHPAVANERYADAAADLREFPRNMQVWQAACLNCHDPHTVQGARRILREGTDGPVMTTPDGARFKQGGNPAVEEVCYACHSADGNTLQGQVNPSTNFSFEVPDIKTDFTTMARRMPIASSDQPAGTEVHSIGTGSTATQGDRRGQDFIEAPENLGKGNLNNRHVECTDCHNPHRVTRNRLFNADSSVPDPAGTHQHEDGVPHTNLASGVLRGIWGVEPVYGSTAFGSEPVTFEVKRGDPGVGGSTDVSAPYLTREYQLCFKCHSNYTYDQPPLLGSFVGGTPPGTNKLYQYTNQAMEYQSPDDHMGEGTPATPTGAFAGSVGECTMKIDPNDPNSTAGGGTVPGYLDGNNNCVNWVTDNHRSWHPAVKPTGRTPAVRRADPNDWLSPFNVAVGTQTMYCTDCHGSSTAPETVVPNDENGFPWGPHGSDHNFLLKGDWDDRTGEATPPGPSNHLCFKCHDYDQYGRGDVVFPDPSVRDSGFSIASGVGAGCVNFKLTNLHVGHAAVVTDFSCTFCHIAIPHGWKNKVFLANLNDVGLEVPVIGGELGIDPLKNLGNTPERRQVRNNTTARYYNGPYYNGAVLKVRKFARSGEWTEAHCRSTGPPGNTLKGASWMMGRNEACVNPP